MKSIFNTDDNAEIITRINQLSANTPAVWGKMIPAQMLAHLQASLNIAFGNAKCHRHWIGIIFGNFGKNRLLKVAEFDKHMPAFIKFCITDDLDFEQEKNQFINLLKEALKKGESALVKYPHPYFATFKPGEWARLNWKHLDHHLRQFGV